MLIRLEDHSLVGDLCAHYNRSGFAASSVGGGMIEVRRLEAPRSEQERRELRLHLRVWEVLNPEVRAELVV